MSSGLKYQPASNRLLVRRDPTEKQSKGGLYLPDRAQEKPVKGEVLAVGPGKYSEQGLLVPMPFAIGDTVLFSRNAGIEIPGEQDLVVMGTEGVLATVTKT